MTDYNVIGEVDVAPTERRADGWIDALINYSPAIGRTSRGRSEVIITIPAKSLDQAVSTGLALLNSACGQLLTFTVMPTSEFDARSGDVALPELIGATEAAGRLGVTRQRVQQMADSGQIPSTRVGNALAFPATAVEAVAAARAAGESA